jgi:hypothetical protein
MLHMEKVKIIEQISVKFCALIFWPHHEGVNWNIQTCDKIALEEVTKALHDVLIRFAYDSKTTSSTI